MRKGPRLNRRRPQTLQHQRPHLLAMGSPETLIVHSGAMICYHYFRLLSRSFLMESENARFGLKSRYVVIALRCDQKV